MKLALIIVAFMSNAVTIEKQEFSGPDATEVSKLCWDAAKDLTVTHQPVDGEVPRPQIIAGCITLEK